jgi:MinD-like ATPase involved in chromosome partitioning or flagellar assembly
MWAWVSSASSLPVEDSAQPTVPVGWRGRLVAVAGAGGTGTSSVAVALAQGFADDKRYAGHVVLADLALNADHAMLHDARDIVPGVQELVEAHRSRRPGPEEVRRLTFDVVNRGYQLLLGLRRHRDWAVLRPRSFEAAIDGLRQAFRVVVADIDADLEGEAECGAIEVEERNVMARTVARQAEAVVLVGMPGVKGIHGLVRSVNEFRGHGVAPERILAVVNAAGRNQRARAEITRTFADLTRAANDTPPVVGPIFLAERRGLDELHRDGARLPGSLTGPVTNALHAILDRTGELATDTADPAPVAPGSLGTWAGQQASAS